MQKEGAALKINGTALWFSYKQFHIFFPIYLLYTTDLPVLENSTVATFADDTAILAIGSSNEKSTQKLQTAINEIRKWTKKNGTSSLTLKSPN